MKDASLLKTPTANIFKFEMIETSSQKNYLVLIQNFRIHLFVQKIRGNSHGNFLNISIFEQFITSIQCFSYTIIQMMSLCLPMRIFELHHFQVFYMPASVHVFSQTSISPRIFSLFWNKDIPPRLDVPCKMPLHIFSNHMLNVQWLVSLTLRLPHHAKEGMQSWFLRLLSAQPCLPSSAASFLGAQQ